MGHRMVRRVPLDFNWPLRQIWKGYINPHPSPRSCTACDGSGYNPATKEIADTFYDHEGLGERWVYEYGVAPDGSLASSPPWRIRGETRRWCDNLTQDEVEALVRAGRIGDFLWTWGPEGQVAKVWKMPGFWCPECHISAPQLSPEHTRGFCLCKGEGAGAEVEMRLLPGDDKRLHIPLAEEVNAWERGEYRPSFTRKSEYKHWMLVENGDVRLHVPMIRDVPLGPSLGHDAINQWILVETRAKRLGVYGKCRVCRGHGEKKLPRRLKKARKNWQDYEPPTGEGWQLWETNSMGSPITPVFATAEELASWCEENKVSVLGRETLSQAEWLQLFLGDKFAVDRASTMVFSYSTPEPDALVYANYSNRKTKCSFS